MDEKKMMDFVGRAVGDVGAVLGGAMVVIGDKRGRCRSMAVGAAYHGFSTLLCTPCSLSQDVGTALGAQAGEARLRNIVTGAGFNTSLDAGMAKPEGHRIRTCVNAARTVGGR